MPPDKPDNESNGHSNGWLMYQRLVLAELERHDKEINGEAGVKTSLSKLRTEFEVLKAKIFAYGAIAGGVVAIIAEIIVRIILKATGAS
jgi:hypothetical protein